MKDLFKRCSFMLGDIKALRDIKVAPFMSPNIKAPGRNKRHQAFLHVTHLDSIFEIDHEIISRSTGIIHVLFW